MKADLDAFVMARRVGSSMEAAVRKGQMSGSGSTRRAFTKLDDLCEKRAFYMDTRQRLDADIESLPIDTFIDRLGTWKIVWVTALEAIRAEWTWPSHRSAFASAVKPILQMTLSEVDRFELVDL